MVDENGKAVVSSDLPLGKYYVKEIATDSHYLLNDAKYPFEFAYAGQTVELVEITANDGKDIENDLIYGSVSGKKVDENGEASAALLSVSLRLTRPNLQRTMPLKRLYPPMTAASL